MRGRLWGTNERLEIVFANIGSRKAFEWHS
jgi:hypothetical protein